MKILLINSTGGFGFQRQNKKRLPPINIPPLGLLYLARSLEDEGHKVEVLELFAEENPELSISRSLNGVDLVGISVSTFQYEYANKIAKIIKQIDDSILIVIGGPHPTFHPKQSLSDVSYADVSVLGDGEQVMKDIVKSFQKELDFSKIAGIYYNKEDNILPGKPPIILPDLDDIPFPSRNLVDKYQYGFYTHPHSWFSPKVTSMVTSRGCPFKCKFCARNDYYCRFRQRSAENVVKEIEEISDDFSSVVIVDENFLTDVKRAHKIMDSLIEKKVEIDIIIQGTRVDTAERGLYKKLKKAGVTFISFGIESGNQDVLDFYNKKITLDQIRKAVDLAHEMDFISCGNFILGAPIETERHIRQTIKFACSLPLDIAMFNPLIYFYGSDLWFEAKKDGKIDDDIGYSINADCESNLSNFTSKKLKAFSRKATQKFYFRPYYIIGEIMKAFRNNDFRLIRTELNYL